MTVSKKAVVFFWRAMLIAYAFVMLCLLFFRFRSGIWEDSSNYREHIKTQYNLIPFRMIAGYTGELLAHFRENGFAYSYRMWAASRNLFGNIGMLIPLGFLLAGNFPKLRRLGKLLLAVTVIIVTVEVTQLLTLAGHCDIDDLILNLLGGSIGYWLFARLQKSVPGVIPARVDADGKIC